MKKIILLGAIAAISVVGSDNSHSNDLTINDCQASLVFDAALGEHYKVILKTFSNGQWSAATTVSESAKDIPFNPIVASDQQDNTLVVWSSLEQGTTRIKYRVRALDGRWQSDANYLSGVSGETTSPTILSNLANEIWLAWASDASGLDDIFIARWSDGLWSSAEQVNQVNHVPDITPSLSRIEGNITLTWRRYDEISEAYVKQSKIIAAYRQPTDNLSLLSDFCRNANYLSDLVIDKANWLFLDKTQVISDHVEIIKNH